MYLEQDNFSYEVYTSQNHLIYQSNPYQIDSNLSEYSGIIRGQWHRDDGKLQSICYGSGIAISKRIVLTCAHSIYLQKKKSLCDSVTFIPKHQTGKIQDNTKIYHSTKTQFIRLDIIKSNQTFSKYPIPQDIALIYLSQDLDYQTYPNVGIDDKEVKMNSQLFISGYPSSQYFSNPSLKQINFQRKSLRGNLLEIQQNTIYHNLPTLTGHSGSGILGYNNLTQKTAVLGVHTHKGRIRNSGVYLSNFLLKRLANYEIQFAIHHRQYIPQINFPMRIKQQIFNELKQSDKQLIRNRSKIYNEIWINSSKEDQQYNDDCDTNSEISISYLKDYFWDDQEDQIQINIIQYKDEQSQQKNRQENILIKQQVQQITDITKAIQLLRYQNQQYEQQLMTPQNRQIELQMLKSYNTCLKILAKTKKKQDRIESNLRLKQQILLHYRQLQRRLNQISFQSNNQNRYQIIFSKFISVSDHLDKNIVQFHQDIISQMQYNLLDSSNMPSLSQKQPQKQKKKSLTNQHFHSQKNMNFTFNTYKIQRKSFVSISI